MGVLFDLDQYKSTYLLVRPRRRPRRPSNGTRTSAGGRDLPADHSIASHPSAGSRQCGHPASSFGIRASHHIVRL